MFYLLMKNILFGPLFRLLFRIRVQGLENIPESGPVILASNHLSVIDSFFIPIVIPRKVAFLAKSEYFQGRGVSGWVVKNFLLGVGQLPIDRGGGPASEASLNSGLRVLSEGRVLGIYPEGTRSPDGKLYRGRTGIARMAVSHDCVVVPVALRGTDLAMPLGAKAPRPTRVNVTIGAPMDFSRFRTHPADRFILRSITDEIMVEIHRLSNQEYLDVYGSAIRARTPI